MSPIPLLKQIKWNPRTEHAAIARNVSIKVICDVLDNIFTLIEPI